MSTKQIVDTVNSIIKKTYTRCPFLNVCYKFGITDIYEKFKSILHLCPFIRSYYEDDNNKITNSTFNYEAHFNKLIEKKKEDETYRIFNRISRVANNFTEAEFYNSSLNINETTLEKKVTVWCSNDYIGMSRHPDVLNAAVRALSKYGVGSGGTRNISGNNILHEQLEYFLANWYKKEAGLVFTSCYVANSTTLYTIGKVLPGCIFISDEENHASMIEGIRNSRCEKYIYKHNDINDLERILSTLDPCAPKVIAFESVNSMNGSIAPIKEICELARQYNCITYLDEVHAVGLYGSYGSGQSELQECLQQVDIISGTLGKCVGAVGGFIVGKSKLVDMIRSYGSGLIFTTSLPPLIMASSMESIKVLKSEEGRALRNKHQRIVNNVRKRIIQLGLPTFTTSSHIIPVIVGNSKLCKEISKNLIEKFNIYVQPINYPTVKHGTERLRIAPTPGHSDECVDKLVYSLESTWKNVGLEPRHPKCNNECHCQHSCHKYIQKRLHA